ncbi:glutamate 5-kinase [Paraliomyxa miuraensis]|uniref:glutamate 5-kinase n=1 Tax=Paraliomyxa miuraensis TaxID=376150 RepID=UPI002258BD74|nr:glutamate 5-kinase [Paraliomyxa miuraensis]MCX4242112.1 glutamate 5-kinase [Paraliomyxa miuraensis]
MSITQRSALSRARRIVVKVGTAVVTRDGFELALGRLYGIVEELGRLHREGSAVLLVTSGAVGMGSRVLGLAERPSSLGLRQACAAVGQGHLMALYTQALAQLGVVAAQVLLTQDDLADRDRALCVRTTLLRLLELRTLPVLNENDSVSVRELVEHIRASSDDDAPEPAFGDNDGLSARVAVAVDADLLVLMTNVDGLYTANPSHDDGATRIPELTGVASELRALTQGRSSGGTGGMSSKLEAARLATEAGLPVLILDGTQPGALTRALRGEDLGTILWSPAPRPARRRHIAIGRAHQGALVVNAGALAALSERKASLLPIGVLRIEGEFLRGDVVEIRDGSGRVHGRGVVNYDADACRALAGRHSSEIDRVLGFRGYDALVTRDNLVLGEV